MLDLVIIGSGPAGLAAAIYAKRAELNAVTIEKEYVSGGQIINTSEVDNYPGLYHMGGFDLATKFREHADSLKAEFITAEVSEVSKTDHVIVKTADGQTIEAKTAIIATGATHKHLNVPGEDKFSGSGVSYCATCDGAFYKGKTVCVVGGGDVAVEDAQFLSRLAKRVYLIHRRDEFRAAKSLVTSLKNSGNVEFVLNSTVSSIDGNNKVEAITVKDVKTGEEKKLETDGVFIAVGMEPQSELFKGLVDTDKSGYIIGDENGKTSCPFIFVAGDVRTKTLRQIVTATADGACAVTSVTGYLNSL